jgi:hypothetical protein
MQYRLIADHLTVKGVAVGTADKQNMLKLRGVSSLWVGLLVLDSRMARKGKKTVED